MKIVSICTTKNTHSAKKKYLYDQKNNVAMQIYTKKGPLAFLPLSSTQTSIVFSYKSLNKIQFKEIKKILEKFNNKYVITRFGKLENFNLKFS